MMYAFYFWKGKQMSFDGNLLYLSQNGSSWSAFPIKYVKAESYSALYSGQDMESYRDANGNLIRNALPNPLPKIEFETRPMLNNTEMAEIWSFIRSRYVNSTEKSIYVKAFMPELNGYMTQKCYVPDCTPTIYGIDRSTKLIRYNSLRIAFIGCGKGA